MAQDQDPAQDPPLNPSDSNEGQESKYKSRPARGARQLTPEEAARLIPGLEAVANFTDPAAAAPSAELGESNVDAEAEPAVVLDSGAAVEEIRVAFEASLAAGEAAGEAPQDAAEQDSAGAFEEVPQSEPALPVSVGSLDDFARTELPTRSRGRRALAAGAAALVLGAGLAVVLPGGDTTELESGRTAARGDESPKATPRSPVAKTNTPKAGLQKPGGQTPAARPTLDAAESPAGSAGAGSGFSVAGWLGERFDSGGGVALPREYGEALVMVEDPDTQIDESGAFEPLELPGEPAAAPDEFAFGPTRASGAGGSEPSEDPEADPLAGLEKRSAVLPLGEQVVLPAPLTSISRAAPSDFSHIFAGRQVTADLLASERPLLTPAVGPVRVRLSNGEYFDGMLQEAGGRRLVLATVDGALTLDLARVSGVDHLDPTKPLTASAGPRVGTERVRVRTKGGVIAGRVLMRDAQRVTIQLPEGGEVTIVDPEYLDVGVEASSVSLVGLRPPG
jgi:hypothetical protein